MAEKILGFVTPRERDDLQDHIVTDWLEQDHPIKPLLLDFGIRASMTVPLISDGKRIGGMSLAAASPRGWSDAQVSLAHTAATELGTVIERARLFQETRRHVEELSALAQVSTSLRQARTVEQMLPVFLEHATRLVGADWATLFLRELETGDLVTRASYPPSPESIGLRHRPGEGVTGLAAQSGTIHISEDIWRDPHALILPGEFETLRGFQANIAVPLRAQKEIVGVMHVRFKSAHVFTDPEIDVLTAIAEMAGNAIQRVALHEQTERQLRRLDILNTIESSVTSSLELRLTLNLLVDQMTTQLNLDAAAILLFNPQIRTLQYAAAKGFRTSILHKATWRLGESHAGYAALERTIVVKNLIKERDQMADLLAMAGEGFVSYLGVPLIARGQVRGVLEIFQRTPLEPDGEWLAFIESLSREAAIAIDNATLFEDLQRASDHLVLAYDETIEGWAHALEMRAEETGRHTQRVTETTLRLARVFGLSEAQLVHIRRGALLHDIGKMGIPDAILRKPGPLTPEEWDIMRQHPLFA